MFHVLTPCYPASACRWAYQVHFKTSMLFSLCALLALRVRRRMPIRDPWYLHTPDVRAPSENAQQARFRSV